MGTDNPNDLLKYKLILNYNHAILATLKGVPYGFNDLTGTVILPAMDFLRSDILGGTTDWSVSDVMDGTEACEPIASFKPKLSDASADNYDVYIFGRTYTDGTGIHDIHMNQGSTGSFINHGDDRNDHNDVWQDGAVLIDLGPSWTALFTVFTQQLVPTDPLGNPGEPNHPMQQADEGSQH